MSNKYDNINQVFKNSYKPKYKKCNKNKSIDTSDLKKFNTTTTHTQTKLFKKQKSTQVQVQTSTATSSNSSIEALRSINKKHLATIGELLTENKSYKRFISSKPDINKSFEDFKRAETYDFVEDSTKN